MISSTWDRSRRIRTAAAVLTVTAVTAAVLTLALGAGVPQGWWPHTGQAFAASSPPAHDDPCRLIVGRAKAYCEHGTTHTAPAGHHSRAAAAWRLLPAGAGLTALAVWWHRAARQRRH
ncbi:hypothetical protein SAMN05216489_00037 [Streptomyces sp. 3213]|uniref:hypothetical protein n=1 Tax=Streptomyces sp. 3213.3 TaxID=1855348 RepID=UPI0008999224|nr:hypothetical protein [Streptomyces sp. 3213.3]SEC16054.1 hypothetical protein SAMN05216489_00037 [Streptomyces sp. 3213] [Streptomyces sp. 3213.3]